MPYCPTSLFQRVERPRGGWDKEDGGPTEVSWVLPLDAEGIFWLARIAEEGLDFGLAVCDGQQPDDAVRVRSDVEVLRERKSELSDTASGKEKLLRVKTCSPLVQMLHGPARACAVRSGCSGGRTWRQGGSAEKGRREAWGKEHLWNLKDGVVRACDPTALELAVIDDKVLDAVLGLRVEVAVRLSCVRELAKKEQRSGP